TVGTLNVFTKGARHFLPDEVALLSALADQASLAIEKARLLRESEGGAALPPALADQASLAIEKARLLRETEEGRALLERLSHAAILMQSSWERGDRLAAFVRRARAVVGCERG